MFVTVLDLARLAIVKALAIYVASLELTIDRKHTHCVVKDGMLDPLRTFNRAAYGSDVVYVMVLSKSGRLRSSHSRCSGSSLSRLRSNHSRDGSGGFSGSCGGCIRSSSSFEVRLLVLNASMPIV